MWNFSGFAFWWCCRRVFECSASLCCPVNSNHGWKTVTEEVFSIIVRFLIHLHNIPNGRVLFVIYSHLANKLTAPAALLFSKGSRSFDARAVGVNSSIQTTPALSAILSAACLLFGCHSALGVLARLCDGVVTQRFFHCLWNEPDWVLTVTGSQVY